MDRIVNNIQLTQNLICVLRTHRTYNLIVRFSKYMFMLFFYLFIYFLFFKWEM